MEAWVQQRLDEVRKELARDDLKAAERAVADLHPADLAAVMEELTEPEKRGLFSVLNAKVAAEVVVELSDYSRDQVFEDIQTHRLAAIIDDMPSDEATDIIADLPDDQAQDVLSRIDLEDSAEVRTLLEYPEDSAGGIMQLELVSVRAGQTASEAIEAIRVKRDELEDFYNVFLVDHQDHILGVLPLSKLILADPDTKVTDLLDACPLVVQADEDQEDVAHKFRRYDVVSAPVVDNEGHLLGRITVDDVVEVLQEEAQEDMARMAGMISEDELLHGYDVFKASRLRLPWLLTNLMGGLLSGWLLWVFRVKLPDALFLLAFIPVIMAMAGNVGIQSSTIIVRGFAVGQVTYKNIWRVLFKEFRVAVVMGLACGVAAGFVAKFWHGNYWLGLVVGLAMTCAISAASLMGTLAPAAFKRLNVDPAISSGPVVTTVNDILGILIYFSIASYFYRYLVI
jgi:magnesium transporter